MEQEQIKTAQGIVPSEKGTVTDNSKIKTKHSPLYFTKEGKNLVGPKPPSAFAFSYPWPPCPTNLGKNKVFRPKEEETRKVVEEAVEEFEKETRNPLRDSSSEENCKFVKSMASEIELAIYWDRHPIQMKAEPIKNQKYASASNLSQVGELFTTEPTLLHNKTSEDIQFIKSRRKSSSSSSSRDSSNYAGSMKHFPEDISPKCQSSKKIENHESNAPEDKNDPRTPRILKLLSKTEKSKFGDLGLMETNRCLSTHDLQNRYGSYNVKEPSKVVRSTATAPSVGVQVTLDGVMKESLKSSYLCPLHGQYKKGIERRDKTMRTDMSSSKPCATKSSRPSTKKQDKSAEVQLTDKRRRIRGIKTAPPMKQENGSRFVSENHANFRDPAHIAVSENRKLRNKILSYCFTKHSIF